MKNDEGKKISEEDRSRLENISKELYKVVQEYARVLAQNLGEKPDLDVVKFMISPGETNNNKTQVEIDFGSTGTTSVLRGCYQDPPGICCSGPCPCVQVES